MLLLNKQALTTQFKSASFVYASLTSEQNHIFVK